MSMSELYAVGVVAHFALKKACYYEERKNNIPDDVKMVYSKAIDLVRSCSNLISMVLFYPDETRDGKEAVLSFERSGGRERMAKLQKETVAHITLVESACRLDDEDHVLIEEGVGSRSALSAAHKRQKWARLCIKCVDKLNVHRLLELVHSTLPLVGSLSRCGELVLEKAHQSLKRAIKQSNHKEIHLQRHAVRNF